MLLFRRWRKKKKQQKLRIVHIYIHIIYINNFFPPRFKLEVEISLVTYIVLKKLWDFYFQKNFFLQAILLRSHINIIVYFAEVEPSFFPFFFFSVVKVWGLIIFAIQNGISFFSIRFWIHARRCACWCSLFILSLKISSRLFTIFWMWLLLLLLLLSKSKFVREFRLTFCPIEVTFLRRFYRSNRN